MILYTDGGCSGNDQRDLAKRKMVALVTDESGLVISEELRDGGSNNIAELLAVRNAVQYARDQGVRHLQIKTHSRNNFAWVYGRKVGKKINDQETVMRLRDEIDTLRTFVTVELIWVPREQNLAGFVIEQKYCL
jgi:ribonuclease HI